MTNGLNIPHSRRNKGESRLVLGCPHWGPQRSLHRQACCSVSKHCWESTVWPGIVRFSHFCDKTPPGNNLIKERLLQSTVQGHSLHGREITGTDIWGRCLWCIPQAESRQLWMLVLDFFYSGWDPSPWNSAITFKVGLPTSTQSRNTIISKSISLSP